MKEIMDANGVKILVDLLTLAHLHTTRATVPTQVTSFISVMSHYNLSHVMRKLAFCICKNKDADQLHSNCAADQSL